VKIPATVFETLPLVLLEIIKSKKPPDKVLDFYFKQNRKWGSRDRRFFAEITYENVRYFRKYWALSKVQNKFEQKTLNDEQAKRVLKKYFQVHYPEIVTPYDVELNSPSGELSPIDEASYSNWFYELGQQELGEQWSMVAKSLNQTPSVFLRTNTLKIERSELQSLLASEGHETEAVQGSSVALKLKIRKSLASTKAFQSGLFEIQDLSSQKVAELLQPKPNEKIVDACAGGGGKTLHIASLAKNKASVLAMDIYQPKLLRLAVRAERAGATQIKTQVIDSKNVINKLENYADALLLDVPCSGSGVIRRHPETKWQFQQSDWFHVQKTQDQILQEYCKIVKPGGRMVFSTCSIFPTENEKKLHQFLSTHSDWSLETKQTFLPEENLGDGFFIATLNKAVR